LHAADTNTCSMKACTYACINLRKGGIAFMALRNALREILGGGCKKRVQKRVPWVCFGPIADLHIEHIEDCTRPVTSRCTHTKAQ
jgi:hypothetical protein